MGNNKIKEIQTSIIGPACPGEEDDQEDWIHSCLTLASEIREGSKPPDDLPHELIPLGKSSRDGSWYFHFSDLDIGQDIRIRQLKTGLDEENAINHFLVRAQSLLKLEDPNFASVYALLRHDPWVSVIGEYITGQPLNEWISEQEVERDEAVLCVKKLAKSLKTASQNKVHHLNLKPSNVIVTEDGSVHMTDACLRRLYSTLPDLWQIERRGWSEWIPPEMQEDSSGGDARSDMYLLGRILVFLLTGGTSLQPDALPEEMDDIQEFTETCLSEAPADRFSSYTFFQRDLSDLLPEDVDTRSDEPDARLYPSETETEEETRDTKEEEEEDENPGTIADTVEDTEEKEAEEADEEETKTVYQEAIGHDNNAPSISEIVEYAESLLEKDEVSRVEQLRDQLEDALEAIDQKINNIEYREILRKGNEYIEQEEYQKAVEVLQKAHRGAQGELEKEIKDQIKFCLKEI